MRVVCDLHLLKGITLTVLGARECVSVGHNVSLSTVCDALDTSSYLSHRNCANQFLLNAYIFRLLLFLSFLFFFQLALVPSLKPPLMLGDCS